jgi:hypothetical protein
MMGGTVSDADDDLEYAALIERLENGDETAKDPLRALSNRRAAEAAAETATFAEQMGGADPEPGTEVRDGPTKERPPYHVDITGKLHGGSFDL